MLLSPNELWEKVLLELKKDISPITITTWFSDSEPIFASENQLTLYTPEPIKKEIIESKYQPLIQAALRAILMTEPASLVLVCGETERAEYLAANSRKKGVREEYTFENFVVGNSNRFAQAAAMAVATKPAVSVPSHVRPDASAGAASSISAVPTACAFSSE